MDVFLNLTIVVVCLLILFIFKRMKFYLSWQGGVIVLLAIYLFVVKFFILSDFKSLDFRFDNINDTLLPTIIFLLGASHAILASLYFFVVHEDNILKEREAGLKKKRFSF